MPLYDAFPCCFWVAMEEQLERGVAVMTGSEYNISLLVCKIAACLTVFFTHGGACTAALFLKAFVNGVEPKEGEGRPSVQWAHLDIAGSMEVRGDLTL